MPYGSPLVRRAALSPHSIVLSRDGEGALTAQTFRVDIPTGQGVSERSGAGAIATNTVMLHCPPDADIERGDAFIWPTGTTTMYRVMSVGAPQTGLIAGDTLLTAICEVQES